MTATKRFTAPVALAAALALPLLTNGCGDDPLAAACCTDFKVGADLSGADFGVDAEIAGKFKVFAQAAGDLSGVAQASLDDVLGACRSMAIDAGATKEEQAAEEAKSPREAVKGWCTLAIAKINATFSAQGSASAALTINVAAPKCEASFSAGAKCNANCSANVECQGDVSAKPPTCEGGKLEVSCEGSCEASAEAPSIACEGECGGTCEGSCSAEAGASVDCEGKCEGTCEAGGSAGGTGVQANGECNGTCKGTCTMKADAKVKCTGTCKGSCNATCKARPGQASVKCDGKCSGKAEPLSCKGGEMKANVECQADAKCEANCNASVQAKAECTPPKVEVSLKASAQGSANAQVNAVVESLKVNLPKIFLTFEARGKAFADMVVNVSGSATAIFDPGKLGVKGTACAAAIVGVLVEAAGNASASFEASGSVAASLTGG